MFDRHILNQGALALPFTVLLIMVHYAWYSSFSRTNVSTNTLLWNTDVVTTPLLAAVFARKWPGPRTIIGGMLGLFGAVMAVGSGEEGNTWQGCGLCLAASLTFALYAVLAEYARDAKVLSVTFLLGLEGLVAVLLMVVVGLISLLLAPAELQKWYRGLPALPWIVFMGFNSLMLNVGWISCTDIMGSFWAAMAACFTIPLSMSLDFVLFGTTPCSSSTLGALLIFGGFFLVTQLPQQRSQLSGVESVETPTREDCRWLEDGVEALSIPMLTEDAVNAVIP